MTNIAMESDFMWKRCKLRDFITKTQQISKILILIRFKGKANFIITSYGIIQ